jgi:trichothecene 3-O-acetyltransferase
MCDGSGVCNFHKVWAKHTAAASQGQQVSSESSLVYTDRLEAVTAAAGSVSLEEFPDWKPVAADAKFLNPTVYDTNELPPPRYALYFISEANLRRLRDELAKDGRTKLSVIEALGAFIWKNVLQAREIDLERYPEAKLSVTVDARLRITDPSLSGMYWGNMCEPNAVARMPTEILCEPGPEEHDPGHPYWKNTLPEAAQRIQHAIKAVDNSAVRRLVCLLNQMPKATSLTWNVDRWPGPDLLLVTCNKYPYMSMDFGPDLGFTEAVRITCQTDEDRPDGRCVLKVSNRTLPNLRGIRILTEC